MKKILILLLLVLPWVGAYEFCDYGEVGSNLTIVSFEDKLADNSDEWIWDWGDEVEISVEVMSGFNDSRDLEAELIFVDESEKHIYLAVDDGDLDKTFSVSAGDSQRFSFVFEVDGDILEKNYTAYLKVYWDNNEDDECVEESFLVRVGSLGLCGEGMVAASYLEISDVTDENLDNSENWIWSVGDEVNISVAVDNKKFGNLDLDVSLILVDEDGEEVGLAVDEEDLRDSLSLGADEEDSLSFVFEVDDLDEGEYRLYVVAVDDGNESICTNLLVSHDVEIRSDVGVLVSSIAGPVNVSGGSTVNYSIVVENQGSSIEERVVVYVYSLNFGIREEYVVYDLGVGENSSFVIPVYFPENASGKSDRLLFSAEYDYDEVKGVYLSSYGRDSYSKKYLVSVYDSGVDRVENVSNVSVSGNQSFGNKVVSGVKDLVDYSLRNWVVGGLIVLWAVLIVVLYFVFHRKK